MQAKEKKILTINFTALKNSQWFQFMSDFWNAVRSLGAETLKIEALWSFFIPLYQLADELLRPIERSVLTPVLVDLDKQRLKLFSGLKNYIKSFVDYVDENKITAANKLMIVIDTYKNIPKTDYKSKTADIYNLLQDMRTKYAAEVTLLDLNTRLTELDKANKAFRNTWDERNIELADEKKEEKMEEVKQKLDWIYNLIIWQFEVNLVTTEDEILKKFVKEWNEVVQKYKTLIAQHEGRMNTDEEDDN